MRDGFDDFVQSRSTGLLRIAYLLTGNRHSAEDLVQEVLEQMYVKWRRIDGMPEAYARRALVNRAANRWRRRGRRPEAPLEGHDVAAPDHSEQIVVRDTVVEALRALPPRQRAAVVLRYLEDLRHPGCGRCPAPTPRRPGKTRGTWPAATASPTGTATGSPRHPPGPGCCGAPRRTVASSPCRR